MKLEERIKSKITILVFIAILMYFLLNYGNDVRGIINNIYSIFFPFILGGCIAFILNIPVTFFSKKLLNCKIKFIGKVVRKYNISISIVASCILIIGIFALISAIIIPNIIQTIKILPNAFDNSITAFQKFVNENSWMSKNVTSLVNNLNIDWNGILNKVKITIITGASSVFYVNIRCGNYFC